MSKRLFLVLGAFLQTSIGMPAAADGFMIETDTEELRRFGNDPFFSELAVGDEAYVYISSLCVDDGTLQLISNIKIASMSEYNFNLKFKREINNSVTGVVAAGESAEASEKASWFSEFGNLYQCSKLSEVAPFEPTLLRVLSIDGFTDIKSLMRHHFGQ